MGFFCGLLSCAQSKTEKPNILLITVDDMSRNSVGIYGCKVADITPNIDHLASEGYRFENAFVNYSICNPSRSTILTGLYPHNHGSYAENGIKPCVVTLTGFLHDQGYYTGIMHKEFHYLPLESFKWDKIVPEKAIQDGRNPELFGKQVLKFINEAGKTGKPFILVANTADPHRPFATKDEDRYEKDNKPFSIRRLYGISEVENPSFLPDHSAFRLDASLYYTSVHRADELVGEALNALKKSGLSNNTIVVFISDNGRDFPFAKHECYVESNATPLIIKWPGKIKPGLDSEHMVTSLDIYPTLLEYLGLQHRQKFDGKVLRPLCRVRTKQNGMLFSRNMNTILYAPGRWFLTLPGV